MDFTVAIEQFFASDAGKLAVAVLVAAGADFALGSLAAARDSTFSLDAWAAWGRKHILGRVFPAWVLLFIGQISTSFSIPGTDIGLITGFGVIYAGTYIAETFASIMDSWGSKSPTSHSVLRRDDVQPVPED